MKKESKIIEIDKSIKNLVDNNGGYCPCAIFKNDDTLCPCKEFREQEYGVCTCGRYEKLE